MDLEPLGEPDIIVIAAGETIWDSRGLRHVTQDGVTLWCECDEEIGDNAACPMHSR